ncbi:GNAT family N-acetyltransferase [Deinococcus sp.]|uniref:GNAT family N-acetyltransferase n=1 Tax=Deinococcus sp. TaxID=47478 RepID=UPI003C7DA8A0
MSEPTLTLRAYRPADQPVCLALFDSNCPLYFHASERAEYAEFLGDPADRGEYWVMERGETVVACGGVWVNAEGLAGLSWGMVRGDLHGQGLGTRLTVYRLERLRLRPEVWRVRLDTSQHTEAFYAKQGFVAVQRTPEGFAPASTR